MTSETRGHAARRVLTATSTLLLLVAACAADDVDSVDSDTAGTDDSSATAGSTSTQGSGETTGPQTGGSSSESGDANSGESGSEMVTLSGVVTDYLSTDPIEGAEVCVYESDLPCTTTDAKGAYALQLEPNFEGAVRYAAADHAPYLVWGMVGTEDETGNYGLLSDATLQLFALTLEVEVDETAGLVAAGVGGPTGSQEPLSGALADLAPAMGVGPVYFTDKGAPSLEQGMTGANGLMGYANVPPGEYVLQVRAEGLDCEVGPGVAPEAVDSVRLPVVAGHVSQPGGFFLCQ